MGKPEGAAERKLHDGVKKLGGKAYKLASPGNNGMPDRLVCLPDGRVLFVELKSDIGKLSPTQKHRIRELENLGQDVSVLYGKAEVTAYLEKLERSIGKDGI